MAVRNRVYKYRGLDPLVHVLIVMKVVGVRPDQMSIEHVELLIQVAVHFIDLLIDIYDGTL